MEILDKKQIENILGSFGIFSKEYNNKLISKIKYFGGSKEYDDLIEQKVIDLKTHLINFVIKPKGLEIELMSGFKYYRLGILKEKINYWGLEQQTKIIGKKSKSIVGRALVGGILLGPVGAIVGGMTGLGDKQVKLSDADNIISLSIVDDDNLEKLFLFTCTDKNLESVFNFLERNFKEKYQKQEESDKEGAENSSISIADEITKLKKLLDDGILTQSEYDRQKEKLLNN